MMELNGCGVIILFLRGEGDKTKAIPELMAPKDDYSLNLPCDDELTKTCSLVTNAIHCY